MVLTKGDDFPIHQTSEPIAYAGTDRNFYDRYFFNGYAYEGDLFFAAAMGIYPHLNIADAAFVVVRDGVETALHASKLARHGADGHAGRADQHRGDRAAAEAEAEGRGARQGHPRRDHLRGPRLPDRGAALHPPQRPAHLHGLHPPDPERPLHRLARDRRQARERRRLRRHPRPLLGHPAGRRARRAGAGAAVGRRSSSGSGRRPTSRPARSSSTPTTRPPASPGTGARSGPGTAPTARSTPRPRTRTSRSSGRAARGTPRRPWSRCVGRTASARSPTSRSTSSTCWGWATGTRSGATAQNHGELAVEREDFKLADVDPRMPHHLHVQALCKVTYEGGNAGHQEGRGVLEQLAIGPHAPSGFKQMLDYAP